MLLPVRISVHALLALLVLALGPRGRAAQPARQTGADPPAAAEGNEALESARATLVAARAARGSGDGDAARASAQRAIALLTAREPGRSTEAEVELLAEVGRFAYDLLDFQTARSARERVVLELERRFLPRDPPLIAAWEALALSLLQADDLEGARELQQRVLEQRAQARPPDELALARARGNLAMTLRTLGNLADARELEELVVEAFERELPADHPHLAMARGNLASTLSDLGDLRAARALGALALESYERTLPPDSLQLAGARINHGTTLAYLGELVAARALEEQALDVIERSLPAGHPHIVSVKQNLSYILKGMGDLPAARALEEQVLAARESGWPAGHPETAAALMNLADTLQTMGEFEASLELQRRAAESMQTSFPAEHPARLKQLANMAVTRMRSGDLEGARDLQVQLLETYERTTPPTHPSVALARMNLGVTLRKLGDFAASRALLESALSQFAQVLPDDDLMLGRARGNLAETLGHLLARGALPSDDDVAEARAELLRTALEFTRSHRSAVLATLLEASPREVEERLALREGEYSGAFSMASGFGLFAPDQELLAEVYLLGESLRSGGLIAARLAARGGDPAVRAEIRERMSRAAEDLRRLADTGASAEDLTRARSALDQAGRELAVHARESLGSGALLQPTLESLAQGIAPESAMVAWRRIALERLSPGGAPVPQVSDRLVAFVLRVAASPDLCGAPQPILSCTDLAAYPEVERAVETLLAALGTSAAERGVGVATRTGGGPSSVGHACQTVRQLVLDPLAAQLAGAEHILLAPDGILHAIPFDALPAGGFGIQPGVQDAGMDLLLGDVLRVELRSSLLERLLAGERPAEDGRLLAIGGCDFDASPGSTALAHAEPAPSTGRSPAQAAILRGTPWERRFEDLPGARLETVEIAALFRGQHRDSTECRVVEGAAATPDALVALAPGSRWLHVATHGWFAAPALAAWRSAARDAGWRSAGDLGDPLQRALRMSPMLECGLALSGANQPMSAGGDVSGLITAQELAVLDLSACELAVLSACDTGAGIARGGQGVASLQRALQMAGARSVITSLWKVPDEVTRDLMLEFYRRVWCEGHPKHAALWAAKRSIRDARDQDGNPRYTWRDWAGWVLSGEPN